MTGGPLLPKDITNPERVEPMMPVGASDNPREAGTFQSIMQKQAGVQAKPGQVASPFDLSRGGVPQLATGPNLATVQAQMLHAQTTLGDINNMLSTPNLKVKPSSKYLLRNKLSEAAQQMRTVNAKVGGDQADEEESDLPAGSGPVKKFLAYVGGSQAALANAQQRLQSLAAQGDQLNPAEFLFVQIKLNKAQQLLDYSSVLLSKAIDDMKMMFNVQL
jgi:hypothetical protein